MNRPLRIHRCFIVLIALTLATSALAQPVTLTVNVDKPGAKIQPTLYGLMTEEINHSYDGGLYAELIQNRIFQDTPSRGRGAAPTTDTGANPNLVHWSLVAPQGSTGSINIDTADPVNTTALKNSLRLDISNVANGQRVGVANEGFWGIPIKPNTEYLASFYAKTKGIAPQLNVSLESSEGKTTFATASVTATSGWKKYQVLLKTGQVTPTKDARFVISASGTGSLWLSLVSLFPPTFNNRPNGNRTDIMQLLVDMKPAFLRYPGGNYLEGNSLAERWAWKTTIGPLEDRTGHGNSAWNYRSSDGMGMLEFLQWCEDMKAEPVLALYDGLSLRRSYTASAEEMPAFVQEGLDAIEYVIGDETTKWGAERAKNGHPKPFKLTYVEIGNEEALGGGSPASYAPRFEAFYDAIRAKYPNLKIISSMADAQRNLTSLTRKPDVVDDHYYMSIQQSLQRAHTYDDYNRSGPKIFVGEWATRVPQNADTCNLSAGVADAAFLTGLERNADVVVMSCYAPLFVNVNPGARQWFVDLIGYDAMGSFGSPSYYVQKMFATNLGSAVLPVKLDPVPNIQMAAPARRGRGPATEPAPAPQMISVDQVFAAASRDDASGDVILKLVNVQDKPQEMQIDLQGAGSINKSATGWVLTGQPDDMNSVAEPMKVAPKQLSLNNAAAKFSHELPAHSVSVIRLKTR